MGTSVTPDQNQQPNSTEENTNQQQTEAQEQTSQTTSTPDTGKAERLLALYEENMRAAHQRASQLQNELDRRRVAEEEAQRNQPPQVPEISASEFWNKPLPHIAQIIREETRKAVQPLYEFKQQFENQSKYDSVKNRFKSDPRYREIFPKIEPIVDQMMNGQDPNDALMNATILSAIGALHTGQLPGVQLEDTPPRTSGATQQVDNTGRSTQQGERSVITPPHLRPNPVTMQQNDNKPKVRELTELEDRLRRENGMTKEEFISWLEIPAHEVAHSRIGKPPVDANANPQSQVQRISSPNTGQGR